MFCVVNFFTSDAALLGVEIDFSEIGYRQLMGGGSRGGVNNELRGEQLTELRGEQITERRGEQITELRGKAEPLEIKALQLMLLSLS